MIPASLSALEGVARAHVLLPISALAVLGTGGTPVSCMAVLLTHGEWAVSRSACVSMQEAVILLLGSASVLLGMEVTAVKKYSGLVQLL